MSQFFANTKGHCYVISLFGNSTCIFSKQNERKGFLHGWWFALFIKLCSPDTRHYLFFMPQFQVTLGAAAWATLGFAEMPTCQGGQHKRSDHIASVEFALQAENKYLVSQVPQADTVLRCPKVTFQNIPRLHTKDYSKSLKGNDLNDKLLFLSILSYYYKTVVVFTVCLTRRYITQTVVHCHNTANYVCDHWEIAVFTVKNWLNKILIKESVCILN